MKRLKIFAFLLLTLYPQPARAQTLIASYYTIAGLHKDGQWAKTKGVTANGENFSDFKFTAACRLYPMGSLLRITYHPRNKPAVSVVVRVNDKIGKRFAKTRIDLTKAAMFALGGRLLLEKGIVCVEVERIK